VSGSGVGFNEGCVTISESNWGSAAEIKDGEPVCEARRDRICLLAAILRFTDVFSLAHQENQIFSFICGSYVEAEDKSPYHSHRQERIHFHHGDKRLSWLGHIM